MPGSKSDNQGPATIEELLSVLTESSFEGASDSVHALGEEIMALQAIYGSDRISLLNAPPNQADVTPRQPWKEGIKLRLCVKADIESDAVPSASSEGEPAETVSIRIAVSLPPYYPCCDHPPQLQLLSRFIGPYAVDSHLFGEVLRIFLHNNAAQESRESTASGSLSTSGVIWNSGDAVLFEGIELVRERVASWLLQRQQDNLQQKMDDCSHTQGEAESTLSTGFQGGDGDCDTPPDRKTAPSSVKFISAPPILDRKSVFIGHAALISSPDQVPYILEDILSDRKLAKASHPIINAWTCRTADGVLHRDCDDDGESAAGGRLAHLLDLLHVEGVLVIVTRFFGGVHLGADRFKLINRAARDALELAGVLESSK